MDFYFSTKVNDEIWGWLEDNFGEPDRSFNFQKQKYSKHKWAWSFDIPPNSVNAPVCYRVKIFNYANAILFKTRWNLNDVKV
jgi:hypothetical protein